METPSDYSTHELYNLSRHGRECIFEINKFLNNEIKVRYARG